MISRGSKHCFQYCSSDNDLSKKLGKDSKGKICKKQPKKYNKCYNKKLGVVLKIQPKLIMIQAK